MQKFVFRIKFTRFMLFTIYILGCGVVGYIVRKVTHGVFHFSCPGWLSCLIFPLALVGADHLWDIATANTQQGIVELVEEAQKGKRRRL